MPRLRLFISHQRADSSVASMAAAEFKRHGHDVYVDVLDPELDRGREELTDYFCDKIEWATHLLAIVSRATKQSWWVPFEIGIATEKERPLATLALGVPSNDLPDYLRKWPYLADWSDVDQYLLVAQSVRPLLLEAAVTRAATREQRAQYTREFYRQLRINLRQ